MKLRIWATLPVLVLASSPAGAESISLVEYTFPGSIFQASSVAGSLAASPINGIGSAAFVQPGNALPDSLYLGMAVVSTTPAAAVANGQFFQFSVTPAPGYAIDLDTLKFLAGRGGSSGPRGWVVRSSVDGFATTLGTSEIATIQPDLTSYSVNLSGSQFDGLTTQTTFRIYGYAPTAPTIGMFFDDINLRGAIAAVGTVPEPRAGLILPPAAIALLVARRAERVRRASVA